MKKETINKIIFITIITPIFILIIIWSFYKAYMNYYYPNYTAYCLLGDKYTQINTSNYTEYKNFKISCIQDVQFIMEFAPKLEPKFKDPNYLIIFNTSD